MKDVYDIVKDILTSGLGMPIQITVCSLAVIGVIYWAWSRERNKELDRRNAMEIEKLRVQTELDRERR